MSSRIDIESLRVYLSVIDCGRVGLAAQHLHLTQSAVSHKIKRLESRVGMKLLKRTPEGFSSTTQAENFLKYARRLTALHDEMLLNYPISSSEGSIVLGATEDATYGSLARVLGLFQRTHPNVNLKIKVAQSLVLEEWLTAGDIDIAVLQVFENKVKRHDEPLWTDSLSWVASPDFPLDVDDNIPFVSFSEHCFYRKAAAKALKAQGRKLNVVFECQSVNGVNEAVMQGIGVGLVTDSVVEATLKKIDFDLPVMPDIVHVMRVATKNHNCGMVDLQAMLKVQLS